MMKREKLLDKIGSADKEWWLWLGYDREKSGEVSFRRKKDIRSYIPEIRDILRQFFMIKKNRTALAAGPVMFGLTA